LLCGCLLPQFTVGDAMRCMYCDECVKLADSFKDNPEDDSAVSVRMREDKVIFSVEVRGVCDERAGRRVLTPTCFAVVVGRRQRDS